jgi:hypothetical protein
MPLIRHEVVKTASLGGVLLAFSSALTRGDMLPVILISTSLSLAQLSTKWVRQAVLRDPAASSPSQDRSR